MFEEYKNAMSIRSRIISDDINRFVRSYKRLDRTLPFFVDLLALLKNDQFLALDPTLFQKVYDITVILTFQFSDVPEILVLRKKIAEELVRQKWRLRQSEEKIIQAIILKEREGRKIPEEFKIDRKEILEMYKSDFVNYIAMCSLNPPVDISDLFYYLTTVNRIYMDYPEYAKERRINISFMIMNLQYNMTKSPKLENYIKITEAHISPRKKKTLQKTIIEFPQNRNFSNTL